MLVTNKLTFFAKIDTYPVWAALALLWVLLATGCASTTATSGGLLSDPAVPNASAPDPNTSEQDGTSETIEAKAPIDGKTEDVQSPSPIEDGQAGEPNVRVRKETIVGYYAWWMKGHWIDMDLSVYDRIIFFTTRPGSDGHIQSKNGWPHAWVNLIKRADSLEIPIIPALALMEADSIKTLFSSPEAIENLVATSMTLIEESRGQGLHLDIELFESVSDSLRDGFFTFTDSLAVQAKRKWPNTKLSLFAPAFDYDGLYDLTRIHPNYSLIMVQGYDLHWQTGPRAGPVATLTGWEGANWEDIVVRYNEAGISGDRMIMTIPYYGYEWPVESEAAGSTSRGEARIVTYAEIDSLTLPQYRISAQQRINQFGLKRDQVSGSPYYTFSDTTGFWQGWFEDESSLEAKYKFVQKAALRGVATFPMGYDLGTLDSHINAFFGRRGRSIPIRDPLEKE